jgi:protein SCO1
MDASKIFEKPAFWILGIFLLFSIPLVQSFRRPAVKVPPVLGQIPNFELTNQDGQKITWAHSFRGSVLVVNFIFTTCPDVCPLLSQQMAKIQNRILGAGAGIKLISISVDPSTDTPEALKAYAQKYEARQTLWTFLTGDLTQIYETVVNGFKVAMDGKSVPKATAKSDADKAYDLMGITHGENFVIVDQIGQIRAYEHARSDQDLNEIVKTVSILTNQNPTYAPKPLSLEGSNELTR